MPNQKRSGTRLRILLVIMSGLIIAAPFLTHRPPREPETVNERANREESARMNAVVYVAERSIRSVMKDPSSAQFGSSFAWRKHGERVACGYVNAKNSFGALTGDTPWIARIDIGVQMIKSYENAKRFNSAWNRFCVGPPDSAPPTQK